MSHDTNHGHSDKKETIISFKNSFWLVIIIVGLFIASLNFIKAESGGEEGEGHAKEHHEMKADAHGEKSEHKAGEAHEAGETHHADEAHHAEAEPAKDTAKGAK